MVVDPLEPNGSALIVSDGFTIAPYDYAAGVFIVPPQAVPIPAGRTITGLDFDVWTHDLLVVCDDATILRNPDRRRPLEHLPASRVGPAAGDRHRHLPQHDEQPPWCRSSTARS